ncbi:MAG: glycoside hydrolase family 11 protein [Marinilabiliaceae bacterium]|nr:glycoside hydrolase family 11 protein [Marinilabiliaceae bacterium]
MIIGLVMNLIIPTGLFSQTFCTGADSAHIDGIKDGYRYELWNQNAQGIACMTISKGALFSGEWFGIENYLARRGYGFDKTKKHHEIGTMHANYNCTYNPSDSSGNSYLSVYGWTVEPLAEYYIIEDWCRWIPSMDKNATFKGAIEVNGCIYDIYENTRVNQPSIAGNTIFQQYFSIRRDKRTSGSINISDHFKKWEELGMELGKMYEVSMVVEGYQSSGSFEFTELEITVDKL